MINERHYEPLLNLQIEVTEVRLEHEMEDHSKWSFFLMRLSKNIKLLKYAASWFHLNRHLHKCVQTVIAFLHLIHVSNGIPSFIQPSFKN